MRPKTKPQPPDFHDLQPGACSSSNRRNPVICPLCSSTLRRIVKHSIPPRTYLSCPSCGYQITLTRPKRKPSHPISPPPQPDLFDMEEWII